MRTKRGLTRGDLIEVKRLIERCNRHENLDLSFNLEVTRIPADPPNHFLAYEGEHLAGAASLQGNREVEVCLMVHPDRRRRGIGRRLLQTVREEVNRRGLVSFLLVCEDTSRSGRAFVETVGAQYRFSEYRMKLDPRSATRVGSSVDRIWVRQADPRDIDHLVRLISTSFGRSEDQERTRVARDLERPTHRFFIALANDEPVGSVGIAAVERRVYIIALNVLPQYRRRGYGRHLLAHTAEILRSESWDEILLEVATDNRDALTLYRSCGFDEVTSYGYYLIRPEVGPPVNRHASQMTSLEETDVSDPVRDFVLAGHGDLEKVRAMLGKQPELLNAAYEWKPGDTETALQAAAHVGNAAIAEFLLARGAPLDICTAAMLGRQSDVERLLTADTARIGVTGAHGIPLLAHASLSGNADLVAFLFDRGARAGVSYALSNAVAMGHEAVSRWLLEHARPDLTWKNFQGKTILTLAEQGGQDRIARLLREHGASE